MIKEIEGNIIQLAREDKFDVIINGTNCFHVSTTKISSQLAREFPKAYIADLQTTKGWIYKLGEYSYHYDKNLKLKIVNIYTQYEENSCHEYAALALSLRMLANALNGDEIIGINNEFGNLNKDRIKQVISRELEEFNVSLITPIITKEKAIVMIENEIKQIKKEKIRFNPFSI